MHRMIWLSNDEIQNFIYNNEYSKIYRSQIDPNTYSLKYPIDHEYVDMYKNDSLREKYEKKITNAIQRSRAIQIHVDYWKLIVTINVEENMPFTIGDVIFFPKKYLDRATLSDLQYTLFHELIHILQRKHPGIFDRISTEILGFRKMRVRFDENIGEIPIFYANPDGEQRLQDAWVYENIMPVMMLHSNRKTFQKGYLQIEDDNDPDTCKATRVIRNCPSKMYGQYFPECSPNHMYHPYEILADTGAKYIVYGKTENKTLDMFWTRFFLSDV